MAATMENIKILREMTGAGMMDVKKALDESNNDIDAAVEWLKKNGIAKAAKKANRVAAEGAVVSLTKDSKTVLVEINSETDFVASNEKFLEAANNILEAIIASDVNGENIEEVNAIEVNGETIESLLANLTATIGEKITLRRAAVVNNNSGSYTHSNKRVAVAISAEGVETEILRDVAMHAAAMQPEFATLDSISEETKNSELEKIREEYTEKMADKPADILENIIKGALNKKLAEVTLSEQDFVKDPSKKVKDILKGNNIDNLIIFNLGEGIEKEETDFASEVMSQVNG